MCKDCAREWVRQSSAPFWWPDWAGKTVVIAATGPSQDWAEVEKAKGKAEVIAINNAWASVPWASALYACDKKWWNCRDAGYGVDALAQFAGLKITQSEVDGVHKIIYQIEWGGTSALHAMFVAEAFGAKRILLTGVDCKNPAQHSHGKHPLPLAQSTDLAVASWLSSFTANAPLFRDRGVEVINCTIDTAVDAFPRAMIGDVI